MATPETTRDARQPEQEQPADPGRNGTTVTVEADGEGGRVVTEKTTAVNGDGDGVVATDRTHIEADGQVTQEQSFQQTEGRVTEHSATSRSFGPDGVAVSGSTGLDVEGAPQAGLEAAAHAEATPTSASAGASVRRGGHTDIIEGEGHSDAAATSASIGVHQENPDGTTGNFLEADAHVDPTGAGARVAGRLADDHNSLSGRAETSEQKIAGGSRTDTVVEGAAEVGDKGVDAHYERSTTTQGPDATDTTTIGGNVRAGEQSVRAEHTRTSATSSTTQTETVRTEGEYTDADTSVGVSVGTREHKFDIDEGRDDASLIDLLAGERPEDHENTIEVAGHAGDHDASVRMTEGSDFDGVQGNPLLGGAVGADYTNKEWSSEEATFDDHVIVHERETSTTIDNNPLDGDIEESSTFRESVQIDGHEAEVRSSSTDRSEINPFDGDVSKTTSTSRGITIDGSEVSSTETDSKYLDVDPFDGNIGGRDEHSDRTVIGDNEWTNESSTQTQVGVDGIDHSATSEYRHVVGGQETGGSKSSRLHADLGGVEQESSASSYGAGGKTESSSNFQVDTDVRDGSVGQSGSADARIEVTGIGSSEYQDEGSTSLSNRGLDHEASGRATVESGGHEAGVESGTRSHADIGGGEVSTDGAAHIGDVASTEASARGRVDANPFDDDSFGGDAEVDLDATVFGRHAGGDADAHVVVQDGQVDAGSSVSVDHLGGASVNIGNDGRNSTAEASADLLDNSVSGEAHAGQDGTGVSGTGTLFGVTVTGSGDTTGSVEVGVDNDGDGVNDSPGEIVDDLLAGVGDGIEDTGEAVDEFLDDAGDAIGDAAGALGDFLTGEDDDDDDADDDDDDGSVGDVIDNLFGWG